MKNCYPTSEKISFLLAMINNRVMRLPEFQRDFAWDPYATDELIESTIQNFPAALCLESRMEQTCPLNPGLLRSPEHVEIGDTTLDNHRHELEGIGEYACPKCRKLGLCLMPRVVLWD